MSEFPTVEEKRFWPFRLNESVDLFSNQVNEWSEKISDNPKAVADAVIKEVEYPFYHGRPDDTHIWNAYHSDYKRCYRKDKDFWQLASETAFIKVGDCEDSSIVCTALEGKLVNAAQTYEILGVVKDADSGRVLGGHGWNYTSWDGKWHLIESTLDTPPDEYPVVDDIREPYQHKKWIYEPYTLFNWKRFEEIKEGMFKSYLDLGFEEKETREKYEALEKAWDLPIAPLRLKREESIWSKIWNMIKGGW